jgi:hypothetical protein
VRKAVVSVLGRANGRCSGAPNSDKAGRTDLRVLFPGISVRIEPPLAFRACQQNADEAPDERH